MTYIDDLKTSIGELQAEITNQKALMVKYCPNANGPSMSVYEYEASMEYARDIEELDEQVRRMEEQLWLLEPEERPNDLAPTTLELLKLPRLALVAFAARCARRRLPVAASYCQTEVLANSIKTIERFSETGRADVDFSALRSAILSALAAHGSTHEIPVMLASPIYEFVPADAQGDSAARMIVRAIEVAAKASEYDDQASANIAASLAEGLPLDLVREFFSDYRILSRLAKPNNWSSDTLFPHGVWAAHCTFDPDLAINGRTILDVSLAINDQLMSYFQRQPERLYDLEPRLFEELIAELFVGFGYRVELTSRTRDGGRDVVAIKSSPANVKYLIECKRWSRDRTVGVGVVRQLYGVVEAERATKGILATTSWLTRDARRFLRPIEFRLEARDFDGLIDWLDEYQKLRVSGA